MEYESYMTDVLGARLTHSEDMQRAQAWLEGTMAQIGLVNVAAEPFMDYGVDLGQRVLLAADAGARLLADGRLPDRLHPGTDGRQVARRR